MDSREKIREELGKDAAVIYGAGLMGQNLCKVLRGAPYHRDVECFIVRSKKDNPDSVLGVRVISMEEAAAYKHHPIFVALHEKHIKDAVSGLEEAGFDRLIPITFDNDLWDDIREAWINANSLMPYEVVPSLSGMNGQKLHIYVVHSEFDKELNENIQDTAYEISIQAGAALASNIYYEAVDNVGDNISDKNEQYCELTVLYWAWKNDRAEYIGISHYRRKFYLDAADIATVLSGDIDMAVTVPIINTDTVKGQYIKDHGENEWDVMAEAVGKLAPQYSGALEKVGDGSFYYAYNMFIAKREVMGDYCSWLFPILSYCEKKIGKKEDAYQNRYIGFLGERLLTVYIAAHPELRVAVVKKHFIEAREK